MLAKRLATSDFLILLVTIAIFRGSLAVAGLVAIGFLVAGFEYFQMGERAGYRTPPLFGTALAGAAMLDGWFPEWQLARWVTLAVVVLPALWALVRPMEENFLSSWGLIALGVAYIGGLGAFVFRLALVNDGLHWLVFTMMATWATDGMAYAAGTRWGRHPFFPQISPKKTWEGAIGGLVGSTVSFGALGAIYGFAIPAALVCGLGIGVAGTLGDLIESLIKRQLKIKDSGSILAGHGGALDRLDSTFFAVTFCYLFVLWALPWFS